MVALSALWLPILVSALFVFIASTLVCMALPFWHRADFHKLPDEAAAMSALRGAASGQYMVPMPDWKNTTPEQRAAEDQQPAGFLMVRNPGRFSFGKAMALYFLYFVVVSTVIGYLTGVTVAPGTHYPHVFRIAGTAGVLAYSFTTVGDSIWYSRPWIVTLKNAVDGVLFALLTAGTFGWLWPR